MLPQVYGISLLQWSNVLLTAQGNPPSSLSSAASSNMEQRFVSFSLTSLSRYIGKGLAFSMGMSFRQYFLSSVSVTLLMVAYSLYSREQFYPAMLFLVNSKVSFVVMVNMALAISVLIGRILVGCFFGQLREVELELIYERAKYSVTETLLALTVFRNELTPLIFVYFGSLIFVKIFHWIIRSRIDHLEQVIRVSLRTHVALVACMLLVLTADTSISYMCMQYCIAKGRTVIILFAFEFGLLIISAVNSLLRYSIATTDNQLENGLNNKGLYLMILDLVSDAIRFCVYVLFFSLIFIYYGLPIHIVRDVWIAFVTFYQRLVSFIRYLRLSSTLDVSLPDATEEELADAPECLICRERVLQGKKLTCGHIFHLQCLRQWLQHQQSCPLCRADISTTAPPAAPAAPQINPLNPMAPMPEAAGANAPPAERQGRQSPITGIPGFYIVTAPEAHVFVEPDCASRCVRTLPQGTVIFVTLARAMGDSFWMQIPDGWVRQWYRGFTSLDGYSPEKYPSSVEAQTAPIHPTSMHRPEIIRTHPPSQENVRTAHMQRLLSMQQSIERLNRNLAEMQTSLRTLQSDLSHSISEEISFLVQEDAMNSAVASTSLEAEAHVPEETTQSEMKSTSHSMTLRRRGDAKQQEEREKRIPAAYRECLTAASRDTPNEEKHE